MYGMSNELYYEIQNFNIFILYLASHYDYKLSAPMYSEINKVQCKSDATVQRKSVQRMSVQRKSTSDHMNFKEIEQSERHPISVS